MTEEYTPTDAEVAVTIELNKKGEVISVRDKDNKDGEFLDLTKSRPKGEVQHCQPMVTLITKENPCWAWYCTSRGCWKIPVPC